MTQLNEKQVRKAAKALLKHAEVVKQNKQQQQGKSELFDDDAFIVLQITYKTVPKKNNILTPAQIPLKHTLHPIEETELCLFTKDPQREYKNMIEEKQVPGVKKVIGLSKLRAKYKTYEAKRQLSGSYDLFLADERIVRFLPTLLGKAFIQRKRHPITVRLTKENITKQVLRACDSTYLFYGTGPVSAVKIARTGFSEAQIVENIMGAIDAIAEKVPKKWANIQALHLKTGDSLALPIYNSLPTVADRKEEAPAAKGAS
eukprot:tig00021721_g23212.t1